MATCSCFIPNVEMCSVCCPQRGLKSVVQATQKLVANGAIIADCNSLDAVATTSDRPKHRVYRTLVWLRLLLLNVKVSHLVQLPRWFSY